MSFIQTAREWIDGDVEAKQIEAVEALIAKGDENALEGLFKRPAAFGTAGLRELTGPGPARMNRAVIRRTTHAVGVYLLSHAGPGSDPAKRSDPTSRSDPAKHCVVVGYDARLDSRAFAEETVGTLVAMGVSVRYFEKAVPTPLVAFALRAYDASAAVVITASHNGKEYNGYKLYAANGAQIVSPADTEIAQLIQDGPRANRIAMSEGGLNGSDPLARPVEASVIDRYFESIDALRPSDQPCRDLGIVYTPLHGVGYESVRRAFANAGFTRLEVVASEAEPNGEFPGLDDPNPEKTATLQKAREIADQRGIDLIIANDPDADRLAVSVRRPDRSWYQLKGNQIGVLLADYQLSRYQGKEQPLLVYSIVSTPMVDSIAAAYGAHSEATLTGFKWVWNAAIDLTRERGMRYVFGFEEALGYCAGDIVRDKDGVSAALLFAELAAEAQSHGQSALDRLAALYEKHGLWVSQQASIEDHAVGGMDRIRAAVARLAASPSSDVDGTKVTKVVDYRKGGESRPRWLANNDMVQWTLETGTRILVRPSGTEPKLKIYVDLRVPLAADADVWSVEAEADRKAIAIANAMRPLAGL